MNYKEIREANKLVNEIENLDRFITDAQSHARALRISTNVNGVTLMEEHKTKVMQVLFGIRGELARKLEKLGVTEDNNND